MIIDKLLLMKISTIETFGYFLVFLATLFEASPFIGVFIPGSLIIFFAGFVAKVGMLDFWPVMLLAVSGAVIGDLAGYLFGRYYGIRFLHVFGKYFLIKKEYIEKSCDIVHAHTGKTLVLGRLNPVTRSVAPLIVGSRKVSFGKFMFFNIIGAALWGFIFVSLGYIFGHGYRYAASYEKWIVISTIVLIAGYYAYYFLRLLLDKANNKKNCVA